MSKIIDKRMIEERRLLFIELSQKLNDKSEQIRKEISGLEVEIIMGGSLFIKDKPIERSESTIAKKVCSLTEEQLASPPLDDFSTDTISINYLMPNGLELKKIETGSELLLAYELDKYAKVMLGKRLSLSGIEIAAELQSREHFSFVVTEGLDVGFIPSLKTLADLTKYPRLFFNGSVEGVEFRSRSDSEYVYAFDDKSSNQVLHGENRSAAYVSLVAYLLVKSKRDGTPIPKLIIDHENYNHQEQEYDDLFVLILYGNQILKDIVELKYQYEKNDKHRIQPEWEAFVAFHRQRGFMNREYTTTEKFEYLKENFEVHDVVLLYQLKKGPMSKTIYKVDSCYPAVIRYFDEHTIRLQYFPVVRTRLTHRMILDEVARSFEENQNSIYTFDDYNNFKDQVVTYSLTECGIEKYSFTELALIINVFDYDGSYQYFQTDNGIEKIWLQTPDTIFAVFEDRQVKEYNKEKFLQNYFYSRNKKPIYDRYFNLMDLKAKVNKGEKQSKVSKRGGSRQGAGRKSLGIKRPVTITLPEDVWKEIENQLIINGGNYKSYAEYFRRLVLGQYEIEP